MSDSAWGAAHGKLILLGEHAVVYGAPALVAGIELGVRAEARVRQGGARLSIHGERIRADEGGEELARAYAALLAAAEPIDHVDVRLEGELPAGVGLGYSAAAAVAIGRAVEAVAAAERAGAASGEARDERVRKRAMAWEAVFHGNPSGVDVAAAMRGGCLRFTRAAGTEPLSVTTSLCLCVGLTGTTSATRAMVSGVARLRERNRALVDRSVDAIASCVENGISALADADVAAFGELMNLTQMLLAGLLLSTETIESMCALARDAGALGAKLTGAGGGGAVVALAGAGAAGDEVAERVVAAWREQGYGGFRTQLGATP